MGCWPFLLVVSCMVRSRLTTQLSDPAHGTQRLQPRRLPGLAADMVRRRGFHATNLYLFQVSNNVANRSLTRGRAVGGNCASLGSAQCLHNRLDRGAQQAQARKCRCLDPPPCILRLRNRGLLQARRGHAAQMSVSALQGNGSISGVTLPNASARLVCSLYVALSIGVVRTPPN